jgi:hypothetical protein
MQSFLMGIFLLEMNGVPQHEHEKHAGPSQIQSKNTKGELKRPILQFLAK